MFIVNKIGVTAGSFDVIHPGHVLLLEDCKTVCDFLIVLLHSDPSIDRWYKNKPVQNIQERLIMLKSIKYVDHIEIYNTEKDLENWLIDNHNIISVRILGSDYKDNLFYTGRQLAIPTYFHNRDHNWSSTNMRKRIFEAEKNKDNENRLRN